MLIQTLQSVVASQAIIDFACWHMADALGVACPTGPATSELPEMKVTGAFVTLKRGDDLRACYGNFGGDRSLREAVRMASLGTVTRDARFPPFTPDELDGLSVDVSILFNYEQVTVPAIDRAGEIEIGRHGLVIRLGSHSGLLLPQVATQRDWDAATFLNHVCLKAGLPTKTWQNDRAELFRFEGLVIPGKFQPKAILPKLRRAKTSVREAAVCGSFYPGTAEAIKSEIASMLPAKTAAANAVSGLMVPHAGWVYSGRIAAETMGTVQIPSSVLVIGPKHTRDGSNWAVMPMDRWQWPGGELETDRDLADRMVQEIPGIVYDSQAHRREHAIEVELPLLAEVAPDCRVAGLVIGNANLLECLELGNQIAAVFKEWTDPPLIITSSDMNHFANDQENRRLDAIALRALETLDPEQLYQTVVDDYHISMCGVRPATVMLAALRQLGRLKGWDRVAYATSADVSGDTSRVVGYAGYRFW